MAGRRFALYFSWSRAGEIGAPLHVLDNRFPALFEFRRAIWPHYEHASNPEKYKQDISGFLDDVILFDFQEFRKVIEGKTGKLPEVIQREGAEGQRPLSDELLQSFDTLIVVSLDHFRTSQEAQPAEVEALQRFLSRPESCLVICPHHDVGATGNLPDQVVEHNHHGDLLVPAQQRLGGYARSILKGLGLPVENRFGLNPEKSGNNPAPLTISQDADELHILEGVTTFNAHPHLPHLEFAPNLNSKIRVLARQSINSAPSQHPFVQQGNHLFNALLWAPPHEDRAGNLFVCDATLWSSAFGGKESLIKFWSNLADLPLPS